MTTDDTNRPGGARVVARHLRRDPEYVLDLLRELVARDMKLRYKRTALGVAWSLVNPLVQAVVLFFVFRGVIRLQIPRYLSHLLTGLLVWGWFQQAVLAATSTILEGADLIKRPGFPVGILPVVTVMTHLIHFLFSLPVLIVCIVLDGGTLTRHVAVIPAIIVCQFLLTLGVAYLSAASHVSFRDTQYLAGLVLLIGFYLTPIFYALDSVPARFKTIYALNPMSILIEAYRAALIDGRPAPLGGLVAVAVLSVVLVAAGHAKFLRASHRFVEEL